MLLGSERLIASPRLKGLRVGVLANPASIDHDFRHIADALAASPDWTLAAIFGPQHGFRSDLQDNMIETPHAEDSRRKVPIFSLYSETREPTPEMLDLIDVLVIDIQDVGARIYTFIYTMANCLRAAARKDLPVIVCDRPNPIGGVAIEGPMLEKDFESFVGQFAMPMRHGMTVAELARLFNEHHGIGAKLDVVPWRDGCAACIGTRPAPLGHALPQHAYARDGHCLSRDRAVRRHHAVRGPWHHAPLRADRRALARR
jgi:uncharacterized protein YbbC (DUF1343 family)